MRRKIIAGNWKMHKSQAEAREFLQALGDLTVPHEDRVVLCPGYLSLQILAEESLPPIEICAQNMHFADQGAYTGEVSVTMLKDIGVHMTLLGHSERRQYFKETDEALNLKVKKAVATEMEVILCCGELLDEREAGKHEQVVKEQLLADLKDIQKDEMYLVNIAYEPVWAIGTGKTASAADAQEMSRLIREILAERFDQKVAEETSILYGGSVKPSNIRELMEQPDIDGVLVGGASLEAEAFLKLIHYKEAQ